MVLREPLAVTRDSQSCLPESAVAVARLNNGVVRNELGHVCTARMYVAVRPCCSTSNNSLMQRQSACQIQ